MTFTCEHCGESIQGVAAVHNGKFIHHRCVEAYEKAKIIEKCNVLCANCHRIRTSKQFGWWYENIK